MKEKIYAATRDELPQNINWGDRVEVTITKVMPYGVWFNYDNLHGFIDNAQLTLQEYKDFQNGIIKPGDNFEIFIGIIEEISLNLPNGGTFLLLGQNSKERANNAREEMNKFCGKYKIGDCILGKVVVEGTYGVWLRCIDDYGKEKELNPFIVAYYTDIEIQTKLVDRIRLNQYRTLLKIIGFDHQVLRVIVEIDWETCSKLP